MLPRDRSNRLLGYRDRDVKVTIIRGDGGFAKLVTLKHKLTILNKDNEATFDALRKARNERFVTNDSLERKGRMLNSEEVTAPRVLVAH
jgi:hypothetical protein